MNITDYIHYYIGQKFIFDNKAWEIVRVSTTLVRGVRSVSYDEDKFMQVYHHEAKLLLRRLDDMTEDEAITVHREATKTPYLSNDKNEYDLTYIKDKGELCSIQIVDLRMPNVYTNINIEGDVLVYLHEHNDEPKIGARVLNQHHITHYLLKQGFDLFGLIDAGLAIDSKTINK